MNSGMGSVEAVKMAVEAFGGAVAGRRIDVRFADHQNKPDIGLGIAREWFDVDHVDVIVDLVNSAIALGVIELARKRDKITLVTGAASTEITNAACSLLAAQWTFDPYQLANSTATSNFQHGGHSWFFITPDYTFGIAAEREISARVLALGGTVLGGVHYPLGETDYASYLLQAKQKNAQVIYFANSGPDLINAVKQAGEFGVVRDGMMLAATFTELEVSAIGLNLAQGAVTASPWSINRSLEAAEWSKRYTARMQKTPAFSHAALYSAVRHYLQAVKDTGSADGPTVMARMRSTPVNDIFATNGVLRADGLMQHDWYLNQVKSPAESSGPGDYFKLIATLPGGQVARPLSESTCPLLKK
jgi:branched-chain amino acid transport system substrate-binding protein